MMDKPVGYVFNGNENEITSPRQRLHLILLGVESVANSTAFYESLGWKKSPTGHAGFTKIDLGGYALCLLPRNDLAKDALYDSAQGNGFFGIGFVYLTETPEEVPMILQKAVAAGGTLVKPATRTPWGIAGYFKDPDGHLFEVDYENPWVFDDEHKLVVDQLK
jgi:predicted enzyme related to lactoylglutathione lyase